MIDEIISILASALTDKMKENKIRVDENADDTQKILNYLDNREHFIDIFPRNVVESEELKYKLEKKSIGVDEDTEYIFNGYNYIKSLFENGKNINYHLSRKIFDSRDSKKDMLLNAWKIKHVHLTDIETNSKTGMKRNRSKYLLFFIVNKKNAYFIDIIEHPQANKFFCFNLLKIIKNNGWMNLIGYLENENPNYVPGSLKPVITNDEDLTKIYCDYKSNIAFDFDGRMYISINGITSSGDTFDNVTNIQNLKNDIQKLVCKDKYELFEVNPINIDVNGKVTFIVSIKRDGLIESFKFFL